jgi:hypothetical protein
MIERQYGQIILVLATLHLGAGCTSPPSDADTATSAATLRPLPRPSPSAPAVAVADDDVCAFQPNGSSPPGCDEVFNCSRRACIGGVCDLAMTPGKTCMVSGQLGKCDDQNVCQLPPSCTQRCNDRNETCKANCSPFEPGCECRCTHLLNNCLFSCGDTGAQPEKCEE